MASSKMLDFMCRPADGETGVAEAVRSSKTLDSLCIGGEFWFGEEAWFGDDDAVELGQALASLESLKRLHLDGCTFALRGLRGIAEALKPSKTLATLSLQGNRNIGDAGAEIMADLLVTNSSLKELLFGNCGVRADGSTAIAVALKTNTVLEGLKISLINIGDAGATAFADALASSRSLKELCLFDCGIGADGSRAIAVALKTNTTLEYLNMQSNDIGDSGATALADALASSTSIRYLHLECCNIGEEGALALGRAVGGNLALYTDPEIYAAHTDIIRKEARRVRAFTHPRREQLLSFGMAMIPRLAAGTQTQEGAPGTSREALPFDRMDRDVFKLIGEAYGHD